MAPGCTMGVGSMEAARINLLDLKDILIMSWCQLVEETFRDLVESCGA